MALHSAIKCSRAIVEPLQLIARSRFNERKPIYTGMGILRGMKVLMDMGHPAHVHFFRNVIRERRGHALCVTARDIWGHENG